MQEIPPLVWCSIFVFLFVFVWLLDFGKSERKRRGPVLIYAVVLLLVWAFMADYVQGFDLWESDGERAVREAQAEEIRLQAQAQYQRELALLRSQGHVTATATATDNRLPVAFWLVVGIALSAIGWGYLENRWREKREAEIRNLQAQLLNLKIAMNHHGLRLPDVVKLIDGRLDHERA